MSPPDGGWAAGRPSPRDVHRTLGEARTRLAAAWGRRRRLGESDCEEIRTGPIAQPVNALSSLAYVACGGWVAARGARRARPAAVAFGSLLGAVGVGSILYHGPCPPGAERAHDTSLAATLGLVVLHNAATVTGRNGPAPAGAQLGAAAAAAMPVLVSRRFTNPDVTVLGLAAVATEVASVRGHRGAGLSAAAAGSLALGALINGLSRTGGPLCRPRSLLQGHAAWHVLSAASLAAWARGALLSAPSRRP
jgi:hypothetical protein